MYSGDFINLPFPIVANISHLNIYQNRSVKVYKNRRDGDDNNFKDLYRFTRENVDRVTGTFLGNGFETRGGALSNVQRMKCFLRYVGDPGFQVGVGEDLGVHQTTVCKTIWSVCKEIVNKADEWIHFPYSAEDFEHEKKMWQIKYNFPSAIGAIDCTHVLINRPGNYKDEFVNRKGLNSFNVQATCNAKEQFTSVDCEWAGSVHDARIWKNSNIHDIMLENTSGALLLADEAYPLTPWTMTPYRDPELPSQKAYNAVHKREKVIIERVFGQVKQRFPFLQSRVRVKTEKIPRMVAACFVLHNVAKYLKDEDFEPAETTTYDIAIARSTVNDTTLLQRGQRRRDVIASHLQGRNNR